MNPGDYRRVLLAIISAKRPRREIQVAIARVGAIAQAMRRDAEHERRAPMTLFGRIF